MIAHGKGMQAVRIDAHAPASNPVFERREFARRVESCQERSRQHSSRGDGLSLSSCGDAVIDRGACFRREERSRLRNLRIDLYNGKYRRQSQWLEIWKQQEEDCDLSVVHSPSDSDDPVIDVSRILVFENCRHDGLEQRKVLTVCRSPCSRNTEIAQMIIDVIRGLIRSCGPSTKVEVSHATSKIWSIVHGPQKSSPIISASAVVFAVIDLDRAIKMPLNNTTDLLVDKAQLVQMSKSQ